MAVAKRWSRYTWENITESGDLAGTYEIASLNKTIIYKGGSDVSVRSRLVAHFASNRFPTARWFRCAFAGWFESGIQMEARDTARFIRKYGRKPKHQLRAPRFEDNIFGF